MTAAPRTRARIFVAVLAGLLIAAPIAAWLMSSSSSPEPDAHPEVLVGEVEGGTAFIAIVRSSEALTIYICGVGSRLATHTGWFFGVPRIEGSDQVIPELTSAGGLELRGRIEAAAASGTLKLNSGQVVSWKAGPARGGAGLYAAEDTLALSGLVVTNDGRMAGNSKLKANVSGGRVTPPAGSVAVQVPGGVPPASTKPVTVTFPVGTVTRTVPLRPVHTPTAKTIVRNGPAVVFLVHGMSDKLTEAAAPKLPECEGIPNTPFNARCEWGIDFIPGLFGTANTGSLFTLAGQDVSGARYLEAAKDMSPPFIDEDLGITGRDANGCVTDTTQNETFDPNAAAHFVTAGRPHHRSASRARPTWATHPPDASRALGVHHLA